MCSFWLLSTVIITIFKAVRGSCPASCSSTDCSLEYDSGCNICKTPYYGRQCQYIHECRYTVKGTEYRGKQSKTVNGIVCQRWAANYPHSHTHKQEDSNYCRNPDSSSYPWCFTTNPGVRWGYCTVPLCSDQCTSPPLPPGADIRNPSKPGIGFNEGYVAKIRCPDGTILETVCNNQTWTDFSCADISCPVNQLETSKYVILDRKSQYWFGDTLKIACNEGYLSLFNNQYDVLTCTNNNKWTTATIKCERHEWYVLLAVLVPMLFIFTTILITLLQRKWKEVKKQNGRKTSVYDDETLLLELEELDSQYRKFGDEILL